MTEPRLMLAPAQAERFQKMLDQGVDPKIIIYRCTTCTWSGVAAALMADPVDYAVCPRCKSPFALVLE